MNNNPTFSKNLDIVNRIKLLMEYNTSLTHDENLHLITEQDKKWISYLGKEITYKEAQDIYTKLKYEPEGFSTGNQIKQIEGAFPEIKTWFNTKPNLNFITNPSPDLLKPAPKQPKDDEKKRIVFGIKPEIHDLGPGFNYPKQDTSYYNKEINYAEAQNLYLDLKKMEEDVGGMQQAGYIDFTTGLYELEDAFPDIKKWYLNKIKTCPTIPPTSKAANLGYFCKDGKWFQKRKVAYKEERAGNWITFYRDANYPVDPPTPDLLEPSKGPKTFVPLTAYTQNDEIIEKWKKNIELASKRLSIPNGKKVPDGYSPFDYEEYLAKAKKISQRCPHLKNKIQEQKTTNNTFTSQTPTYSVIATSPGTTTTCEEELDELKSQYKHEHFPRGIDKKTKLEFEKKYQEINDKIKKFKDNWTEVKVGAFTSPDYAGVKIFDYDSLNENAKYDYNRLLKQKEDLELYYGYDGRSSFDRFMDSTWGQVIQFGAPIALMIAGYFTGGATWIIAADILLNLSLAGYYLQRGNTEEALMFFIFAGLTQLKGVYEFVKVRAGSKVLDYTKISNSIMKKMIGIQFRNYAEVKAFEKLLSANELFVFRTVRSAPVELLTKDLETLAQKVAQRSKKYKPTLTWDVAKNKVKGIGKEFVGVTAAIMTVETIYNKIEEICRKNGIEITWGEKNNEILNKIKSGLTESELEIFFKKFEELMTSLAKKQSTTYVNRVFSNNPSEESKDIYNRTVTEKKEQIKKQIEELEKKEKEKEQFLLNKGGEIRSEQNRDSTLNWYTNQLNNMKGLDTNKTNK